ncbi:ABC transporter transmembrane domain-containing protein, partial [Piscinibacterium candidicorallinum]
MRAGGLAVDREAMVWALGSACAIHRIPFSSDLLAQQFPPPHDDSSLLSAARALGFKAKLIRAKPQRFGDLALPCIALVNGANTPSQHGVRPASTEAAESAANDPQSGTLTPVIISQADAERVAFFRPGQPRPEVLKVADFEAQFAGQVLLLKPAAPPVADPDEAETAHANGQASPRRFSFAWFIPELLKHKKVWRDVLLASLVLQLLALATPLFTQAIIDKVVVHRTQSTLIAIAVGMTIFMLFTALLTWVRQYLILHTGNRVDAVLGYSVFEHLFKLPPRYFTHRPTGVIAARLQGVETIREFISSAAVSLILDIPFLLICVALMFWYSVPLTLIALGILTVIVIASAVVAPLFQKHLNEQFLLGARNQAFVTEYVGGMETVKSLQMEPQLKQRYAEYLASYLNAGFRTKQLGNTYNVVVSTLEQAMTLLILLAGAWIVMTTPAFTIGMLVAFQ